jgi:tetratricopeptide (TPR) repeat protein
LDAMSSTNLLERLKRARIVQVLLVYLGASWVILQIAEVLSEALSLPAWVLPVCVLLLMVGLIIILATAWVQSLPATTAAEEAGEIPTDWEVAPGDALATLRSGKLPHLTWGRAILGGVVALSLLFGGTGLYVGLTGRPGLVGPQEAGADVAAAGIAVLPFAVTGGEELELWRDGLVDVFSTNLDGMGGFRTIDSRTVLARWRERVVGVESPDMETALRVAAETGARYGLVGTLVGNPAGIRISAELVDLSNRAKIVQVAEEGAADQVLDLTSSLSVDLIRELLGATAQRAVQDVRLGALTTTSLPALRAYLEGEAAFRDANFAAALASYEKAVELDSLFALAWMRLSSAYGWMENIGSTAGGAAGERSAALVDRLPARDRVLVQATEAARTGDASFYPRIREAVTLYPDDPDLWFELGEYIYHVGVSLGLATWAQGMEAFEKAVELDPDFGPYQVHPLELTIARGDREGAEARLARYREATEDERNITEFSLAIPLLLGDSAEYRQALEASLTTDIGLLNRIRIAYTNMVDDYDRLVEMLWVNRNRAGADHQWILYGLGAQGALARADRLLDSLDVTVSIKGLAVGWMLGGWSTAVEMSHRSAADPAVCEEPTVNSQCQLFVGWGLARSGDVAGARRSARYLRTRAETSEFSAQAADAVEGTIAAEEGRVAEARRLLGPIAGTTGNPASLARISLAEVELGEGNTTEAIRFYTGELDSYNRFHASRALAHIYDERGDVDQARSYYRRFLTITRAGDQALPEIVEAKAVLARLGG